jgi:DeoR family transcriptional regulator, fructose operon transcriptional repressor
MLIPERQSRLQTIIARRGMIDLESLSKEIGVSSSTIRRDLNDFESRGLVRRTHGGVVWTGEESSRESIRPYAFEQRLQYKLDAKHRIAVAASKLVHAGETILLDGGTTTYYLARELVGQRLQLVTNSLPIATLFQNDEHAELVVTGGLMYPRYGVLLGPSAESSLSSIHAKTLFLSVAGLHRGELFNQNMLLVQAEQRMMEQSQRTVLLIDASKFGQQALVKLGDLSKVDVIVTDVPPAQAFEREIADAGCQLIVAP